MKLIVKRKVAELSLKASEFLLPLFEAVINAIEAIQEANEQKGLIKIKILRDDSQQSIDFKDEQKNYLPIKSFIVEDNGVGFDHANFIAFGDAYTDHKFEKGGKGVGRFTILRAFKQMKIHSTFEDNNSLHERNFTFDIDKEVDELIEPREVIAKDTGSIVELSNYLPDYYSKSTVSNEYIAEKIVEHCLLFYISNAMPEVILIDDFSSDKEKDLENVFRKFITVNRNIEKIVEKDENFQAYFIHRYSNKGAHKICFCGNTREVENVNVKNYIPNLSGYLEDEKGKYYLLVYVIGTYLDKNVYEVRNTYKFPKRTVDKDAFHKFSLEELIGLICEKIELRYAENLLSIADQKLQDIQEFILEEGGIEYRHLLNNPDNFKNIPPNFSKEKLDSELHKINYELEKKHKQDINSVLDKKKIENYKEYEKELKRIVKNEHQFSISKLANYVVRRKVIIKVFDQLLGFDKDDHKYRLEEDLHNIIFPMGGDSNTIPFTNHNLWLLDEKLTFHTYVASDKKIRSIEVVESNSDKEPDLAIFNKLYAFSSDDQFQSIIIFEFKRPGRIMTGGDRDVDKQVKGYFEDLLKSRAKNYKGQLLNIRNETPKFGYVICEIDKKLEDYLIKFVGFNITSSSAFYKYLPNINLYIEVMTYQSMLRNVETRHRAFFKQLGIDYL